MFNGYRFQRGPCAGRVEDSLISAVDFMAPLSPDMNLLDLGESTFAGFGGCACHLRQTPLVSEDLGWRPHAVLVGRVKGKRKQNYDCCVSCHVGEQP